MKLVEHYLSIAVETSCWECHADQPAGEKNEIIEIGITPFSLRNLAIGETTSILIKPSTSKISEFCTRITTITQELADTGISFEDACKRLEKDFKTKDIPWVSWGGFDSKMIQWQCNDMKVPYPCGAGHVDYKNHFSLMMGLENEWGIKGAMKKFNMEFEGERHRAGPEAYNTARIVVEMFRRVRENEKPKYGNVKF